MNEYGGGGEVAGAAGAAIAGLMCVFYLVILATAVVALAGMWKAFVKAGKPGWTAIVPIYNYIVWLEVVGKPIWWILLLLVPCVNFVVLIMLGIEVAKKFGQGPVVGALCGIPVLWAIGWCIIGFGSAQFQGSPTPQQ